MRLLCSPSEVKDLDLNSASAALHAAVKSIPEGKISGTAKAAKLDVTQLARLRRGESLNIQIETLKRLAIAMGKTSDELIGLSPADFVVPADAHISTKDAAKVRKKLSRVAEQIAELVAALPRQVPAFLAVSQCESRVDRPQNAYLGRGAFSDFHALRSSSPFRIVFPRVAFANARATFGISHHATPESGPRAAVIR